MVMPTYNRADFLPRSIESILNQTYKNLEFIIVDDGSVDSSLDLIQKYIERDSRIKVLNNGHNRGISFSRNAGLAAARGKYIAVMDSDDYSMPHRLEKQVAFMEEHPELTLSTSWKYNGRLLSSRQMVDDEPELLYYLSIGHGEWMVRRSFLVQHKLTYDVSRQSSEDYELLYQIIRCQGKIGYINEVLYVRRTHRSNSAVYYGAQAHNSFRTSRSFQKGLGIPTQNHKNRCVAYRLAVEANKTKHFFNQAALERTVEVCDKKEKRESQKQ